MPDPLSEDWHGRYWYFRPGLRTNGGWASRTYSARCSDPECLWSLVIDLRDDGWWWDHDDLEGDHQQGGPFEFWQEAAEAAVTAGLATPRL